MKKFVLILILIWFFVFGRVEAFADELSNCNRVDTRVQDALLYKAGVVKEMLQRTLGRFQTECSDPSVNAGDCLYRLGLVGENISDFEPRQSNIPKSIAADERSSGCENFCLMGIQLPDCPDCNFPPPPPEYCGSGWACGHPDCPNYHICCELCPAGEGGSLCECDPRPPA